MIISRKKVKEEVESFCCGIDYADENERNMNVTDVGDLTMRCGCRPSWRAARAVVLQWFDDMLPVATTEVQPLSIASASMNSSFLTCQRKS